jgi:N-carbamoylputrescine amidase
MKIKLGLIQMRMERSLRSNVDAAIGYVREAAAKGANVVLLPELFENHYFCQEEREEYFGWAHSVDGHPFLDQFSDLARELGVVLPISFFERAGQAHYNSLAMIDADGRRLGVYRKSHIPDGPGYEEKYYFNPGDTGFKTWNTRFGRIGVGICWDQWFPECARAMALSGADLLLYPTAIGSEPAETVASPNTPAMWQRAMIGHAVHNSVYVAAANRIGTEVFGAAKCDFYGHSFSCDYRGEILCEGNPDYSGVLLSTLDLASAQQFRAGMGFFRDRRPDLYESLLTLDGCTPSSASR